MWWRSRLPSCDTAIPVKMLSLPPSARLTATYPHPNVGETCKAFPVRAGDEWEDEIRVASWRNVNAMHTSAFLFRQTVIRGGVLIQPSTVTEDALRSLLGSGVDYHNVVIPAMLVARLVKYRYVCHANYHHPVYGGHMDPGRRGGCRGGYFWHGDVQTNWIMRIIAWEPNLVVSRPRWLPSFCGPSFSQEEKRLPASGDARRPKRRFRHSSYGGRRRMVSCQDSLAELSEYHPSIKHACAILKQIW